MICSAATSSPRPRAFATVLVLWTIAIAAVVLVALQSASWRQTAASREAVARVRAKWAARAGVEMMIARLARDSLDAERQSHAMLAAELASVSTGELLLASYTIAHHADGRTVPGPADAHAKLNVNLLTRDELMMLPDMTEDIADSILDWIDADDDTRDMGAEAGYYTSQRYPYLPRNAPVRSLAELELIAGVRPEYVRGEDWNLNGRLDPGEDDGALSWPPDNADGRLDAGWSAILTAVSVDGGLAPSGEPRLDLRTASADQLVSRVRVSTEQAEAILAYAAQTDAAMSELVRTDLAELPGVADQQPQSGRRGFGAPAAPLPEALTPDQLAALIDETTLDDDGSGVPLPGKVNINTCPAEVLDYVMGIEPGIADALIFEREARADGFASIVDLLEVPSITRELLADLMEILDVRSNVFVVTSRGRDAATGLEVEMIATLDRSTLPITIKDLVVR